MKIAKFSFVTIAAYKIGCVLRKYFKYFSVLRAVFQEKSVLPKVPSHSVFRW